MEIFTFISDHLFLVLLKREENDTGTSKPGDIPLIMFPLYSIVRKIIKLQRV